MPDDTLRGKRLATIRLVAAGLHSSMPASQEALDAAERLVDRLIDLAQPQHRLPRWTFAVSIGALLVFCGLVLLILPGGVR